MSTVVQRFGPRDAVFPAANFAAYQCITGTAFPVESLSFGDAATMEAYFAFKAVEYGSGNLTARIRWYAASATSGNVVFGGNIAAYTPETDTGSFETKALGTEQTVTDAHLGTQAKRIHEAILTISNLDSLAIDDEVVLRIARKGADGSDTLTGNVSVVEVTLEYSDT